MPNNYYLVIFKSDRSYITLVTFRLFTSFYLDANKIHVNPANWNSSLVNYNLGLNVSKYQSKIFIAKNVVQWL
jgi:hypothetical protein